MGKKRRKKRKPTSKPLKGKFDKYQSCPAVTVIKPENNFSQGTRRKAIQLLLEKKCDIVYDREKSGTEKIRLASLG